jgi:hypothetical protein
MSKENRGVYTLDKRLLSVKQEGGSKKGNSIKGELPC